MRVLEHLLIAHRRECGERRRYVADLEYLVERLNGDAQRLHAEIRLAEMDGATMTVQQLIERRTKLEGSIADVAEQLLAARAALAAAELQLKRHELFQRSGALAANRTPRRRR
jgi:hypothetical protein